MGLCPKHVIKESSSVICHCIYCIMPEVTFLFNSMHIWFKIKIYLTCYLLFSIRAFYLELEKNYVYYHKTKTTNYPLYSTL